MNTSIFYSLDSAIRSAAADKTSAADMLLEKKYFYAAVNSVQAAARLRDLNQSVAQLIQGQDVNVEAFNKTLESYLITLLGISSITSLDNSVVFPHYYTTKLLSSKTPSLDPDYLETIMYTSSKTWGTTFGSLGYFLHKGQYTQHYATPSQLINQAVQFFADESIDSINKQYLLDLTGYALEDTPLVDTALYNLSVDFINLYPNIKEAYSILSFLEQWWGPSVGLVFSDIRNYSFNRVFSSTNSTAAYKTLKEIARAGVSLLMDEGSIKDIAFKFVHNNIPTSYFNLLPLIINALNSSQYQPSDYDESDPYQKAMQQLIDSKLSEIDPNILRVAITELSSLFYPGGYNLLLIAISASLLNKAYILSCSLNADQTQDFNTSSMDPEVLGRWLKLVYLAGYTLKKSNDYGLNLIGSNLIATSFIPDSSPDQITDLSQ